MPLAPENDLVSIDDLTRDPYGFYKTARAHHPVVRVKSVGRTMLTKAADTKFAKDNWEIFSSDDPNTPMKRAFQAHTLMRKDGAAHMRERNAMTAAFSQRNIRDVWVPLYEKIAADYIGRLPRGEVVELFHGLAAPVAAVSPVDAPRCALIVRRMSSLVREMSLRSHSRLPRPKSSSRLK